MSATFVLRPVPDLTEEFIRSEHDRLGFICICPDCMERACEQIDKDLAKEDPHGT